MNDPVATTPSIDDRNLAMLAHLLGIVSGFVGALIIWLIKKDQSAYVDEQGKEALNFQITMLIAFVGAWNDQHAMRCNDNHAFTLTAIWHPTTFIYVSHSISFNTIEIAGCAIN